jgi:glycosyltransferase involved in cell wall biosynthesis
LAYKNVDAVSAAFEQLPDRRLVIVGTGPEQDRLVSVAGPNVCLLGKVDDAELAWLYANCAGVVAAAHEDFGLTPVEAASCGKPVAALRSGGFLETVVEGRTGLFFDHPDSPSIALAVRGLLEHPWDSESIEDHAEYFVESFFAGRLKAAVGAVAAGRDAWVTDGVAA